MNKQNYIDVVWERICQYEREVFFTVKNIEFFYVMNKTDSFSLSKGGQRVTKNKILQVLQDVPVKKVSDLNVYAQSYIAAIINDERIRKDLW